MVQIALGGERATLHGYSVDCDTFNLRTLIEQEIALLDGAQYDPWPAMTVAQTLERDYGAIITGAESPTIQLRRVY